jgi:hypothetical protein
MSVYLGNPNVVTNVPAGTVVGTLTATQGSTSIPCTFSLVKNPNNYFAINGNNLVTAQSGSMVAGPYSVQIDAVPVTLSDSPTFTIAATSPDGSTLMVGVTGSLVTSDGIWTFSATKVAHGNYILLNGQVAGGGSGTELKVAADICMS